MLRPISFCFMKDGLKDNLYKNDTCVIGNVL